MKRVLCFLFPVCALIVALSMVPDLVRAESPLLPVVKCANDKCVMAEKDWNELRAYHLAMMDAMVSIQQQSEELSELVKRLRSELLRNAFCQART